MKTFDSPHKDKISHIGQLWSTYAQTRRHFTPTLADALLTQLSNDYPTLPDTVPCKLQAKLLYLVIIVNHKTLIDAKYAVSDQQLLGELQALKHLPTYQNQSNTTRATIDQYIFTLTNRACETSTHTSTPEYIAR